LGLPSFFPATPYGIIKLLEYYQIPTEGKHCVVVGRSNIVGTPISLMLSRNTYPGNATVTLTHSKTQNLKNITLQADILIAAVGKPLFVKADMVKNNAVIIDVGIHRIPSEHSKSGFKLIGDVDFENVKNKASYITPVPGGVGPMTIAALLLNTLQAYKTGVYAAKV
jgi:methylenetetrahydrofolate dehydrogenase (NADP+)/methenyltetrahydrofolate cyclohydrolase